jgi:hypothetical protein
VSQGNDLIAYSMQIASAGNVRSLAALGRPR